MIVDSVNKIRDVEKEDESKILEVQEEAKEKLKQATITAKEKAAKKISEAKENANALIEKVRSDANQKAEYELFKSERELDKFGELSQEDLEEAIDYVIERIVSWYGNSENGPFQFIRFKIRFR